MYFRIWGVMLTYTKKKQRTMYGKKIKKSDWVNENTPSKCFSECSQKKIEISICYFSRVASSAKMFIEKNILWVLKWTNNWLNRHYMYGVWFSNDNVIEIYIFFWNCFTLFRIIWTFWIVKCSYQFFFILYLSPH